MDSQKLQELQYLKEAILKGMEEAQEGANNKIVSEVLIYKRAVLYNIEQYFNLIQSHAIRNGD